MNNQRASLYPPVYKAPMPRTWWLRRWSSFRFMMRELTAVFIGIFALVYLIGIDRFVEGPEAYEAFLGSLQTPFWKALSVMILLAALYHTVTWFHLMPQIIILRVGAKTIPASVLLGISYLLWAIVSGVLLYGMLRE